jgi:hypothetical protein
MAERIFLSRMSDIEAAVRAVMPIGTSEAAIQQWTHHAVMFCGPTEAADSRGSLVQRFDKWVGIVQGINPLIGKIKEQNYGARKIQNALWDSSKPQKDTQ